MRKVTSVYVEEYVLAKLRDMDVNISDMVNLLLSNWIKHLQENDMMGKTMENATAAYFLEQIKRKVYE